MKTLVSLATLAALAIWAIGCGGGGGGSNGESAQYKLSVTRLKSLNTGFVEYMSDNDDVLPLAGKWMDSLLPYVKSDETLLHSPAVTAPGYGYALNADVAGQQQNKFASPATTISLFDSTDLARNATDALSTQPSPARYGKKNTIAYLDGHVQDEETIGNPPPTLYQQSQTRLKKLELGTILYANDWDDALPTANQWMDQIAPYVKNEALFHSPAIVLKDPTKYGYALNSAVAGASLTGLASPATTISLFDSTVLTRNATAATTTLPQPPRYKTANTIAYTDGHVQP